MSSAGSLRELRGDDESGGCVRCSGTNSRPSAWLWQLLSTTVLVRRRKRWSCSSTPPHGDRPQAPEPGRVRCTRSTTLHGDRTHLTRGSGPAVPLTRGRSGATAACAPQVTACRASPWQGRQVRRSMISPSASSSGGRLPEQKEEEEKRRRKAAVEGDDRAPGRGVFSSALSEPLPVLGEKEKEEKKKKLPKAGCRLFPPGCRRLCDHLRQVPAVSPRTSWYSSYDAENRYPQWIRSCSLCKFLDTVFDMFVVALRQVPGLIVQKTVVVPKLQFIAGVDISFITQRQFPVVQTIQQIIEVPLSFVFDGRCLRYAGCANSQVLPWRRHSCSHSCSSLRICRPVLQTAENCWFSAIAVLRRSSTPPFLCRG